MSTLRPEKWLSDQIINVYFKALVARNRASGAQPSVYAYDSFSFPALKTMTDKSLMRSLDRVDVFQYDILLFPIWEPGHFSFLFVDVASRTIVFCDSYYNENNNCLDLIESYLMETGKKTWSKHTADVPKQRNTFDCGVFVLLFAEHVARGVFPNFTQADVNDYCLRQSVILDIVENNLSRSTCTRKRVTDSKENLPGPCQITPNVRARGILRPRKVLGEIQASAKA